MTDVQEQPDAEEGVPTPSEPLGEDDTLLDEPEDDEEDDEEPAGPIPAVGATKGGYPPQPLPEDIDITNEPG